MNILEINLSQIFLVAKAKKMNSRKQTKINCNHSFIMPAKTKTLSTVQLPLEHLNLTENLKTFKRMYLTCRIGNIVEVNVLQHNLLEAV